MGEAGHDPRTRCHVDRRPKARRRARAADSTGASGYTIPDTYSASATSARSHDVPLIKVTASKAPGRRRCHSKASARTSVVTWMAKPKEYIQCPKMKPPWFEYERHWQLLLAQYFQRLVAQGSLPAVSQGHAGRRLPTHGVAGDSHSCGQMFPRARPTKIDSAFGTACTIDTSRRLYAWITAGLGAATAMALTSPTFASLAYLYFALRDRLTFDLVTRPIYEGWRARSLAVSVTDVSEFLGARIRPRSGSTKMETEHADKVGTIDSRGIARFRSAPRYIVKTDSASRRISRNRVPPALPFACRGASRSRGDRGPGLAALSLVGGRYGQSPGRSCAESAGFASSAAAAPSSSNSIATRRWAHDRAG